MYRSRPNQSNWPPDRSITDPTIKIAAHPSVWGHGQRATQIALKLTAPALLNIHAGAINNQTSFSAR
ncbi:hypothetical protein OF001_U550003 [Pseudomonas sp. OF001]|nr:hypothetical protein OF001_U550003 [Pseudomonas sp. OF001]